MKNSIKAAAWAAGLSLLLAAVAVPASAQYRRPWGPASGAMDLTEEQLSRIQDIRLAFQDEIIPLETKWRKLSLEIDGLAARGQTYEAKLREIESVEAEMDKRFEEHWNKIRSVLTDEQRVLFDRYGGLGMGLGGRFGRNARLGPRGGMGMGPGRGMGYGRGPGLGRGYGGYGAYGRGYGPGRGRGYYCPWRRW